ncbi:SRPBCC family protein [Ideonella azotifigens]|uniref:K(+)-transporting ATPase subunit F n=1 Tax=Ideonella azotifigens TaxID=513160 RepID=A0ABN1JPS5_9BURK|nr:SRPBCC family protein [Ideonella azotifigens]MCD2340109.1 SRPBCC family protein [Ideonella azotifigens]
MLKALSYGGLALLAVIVLVLIAATFRPDTFRVERHITIAASPEKLYPFVSDMHQFNRWNPYLRKDPASKQRYGEITAGPGGFYAWESESLGVGSMRIEQVQPPREVHMALEFVKPFEAHNQADFTLTPQGQQTVVTWAMHGPANYLSKLMDLLTLMDRMVGRDFEDGLQNLKALAE